jgi:hypothetical protein
MLHLIMDRDAPKMRPLKVKKLFIFNWHRTMPIWQRVAIRCPLCNRQFQEFAPHFVDGSFSLSVCLCSRA